MMWVHASTDDDPIANLALEDVVLSGADELGPGLLFYRNRPSVVVGKNQNPWRECDVPWCRAEGLTLARRISGGGTVVHDPGTLNYAMVLPRASYHASAVFGDLVASLVGIGVDARLEHGNSLFVGDHKVSGNAFCFRGQWVLHHGTFLISADVKRLRRALARSTLPELTTRAVASRPAPVRNLQEIMPKLNPTMITRAITERMAEQHGRPSPLAVPAEAIRAARDRMMTWEWRFGHTPRFEVALVGKNGQLDLVVQKGIIERAGYSGSDASYEIAGWTGCRFDCEDMRKCLALTAEKDAGLEPALRILLDYDF